MGGRSFPVGLLLVLAGTIFAAPSPGADVVANAVKQLVGVNHGPDGPVATSTQVVNSAGDKLDFSGAHFFGRDKEQHDFNRQAHVNLELARNVDPQLRRFLGKSIVKREGPYPPAVVPPTHYEPPTTTPPPTTTTTTEAPPTVPPEVPHEVYGLPPGVPVPVPAPCSPNRWGEGPDCVPAEPLPLASFVYLPAEPPLVLCNGADGSGSNSQEPSKTTLYEFSEVVGNLFGGEEEEEAPAANGETPPSDGASGCTDCLTPSQPPELPEPSGTDGDTLPPSDGASGCTSCTFSQLPELPALVYPSLPASPPATVPPPPEHVVPNCNRAVHASTYAATETFQVADKTAPREQHDETELVDLRQVDDKQQASNVLSTQSQVILVRGMEPYPVLKAKVDRTPASRQTKPVLQRGPVRFVHTFTKVTKGLKEDQVDELNGVQPGDTSQFVLCTVDCYALEEKVRAPDTPAVEIPSDGRLW